MVNIAFGLQRSGIVMEQVVGMSYDPLGCATVTAVVSVVISSIYPIIYD